MNILVIGSDATGLAKAVDWLQECHYVVNNVVFIEESRMKLMTVHDHLEKQPHDGCVYNLSAVPDGEENTLQSAMIGRAMDINDIIKAFFPDRTVDRIFFAIKNKKAKIILANIDTEEVDVYKHYFCVHED